MKSPGHREHPEHKVIEKQLDGLLPAVAAPMGWTPCGGFRGAFPERPLTGREGRPRISTWLQAPLGMVPQGEPNPCLAPAREGRRER